MSKLSFIGKIDREWKGGLGVVGDDALAGILAGILQHSYASRFSISLKYNG